CRGGRCSDCWARERRPAARRIAHAPAPSRGRLEIDRDALLFPVAVAGGVEPLFLACRRRRSFDRLRIGQWRRRAEIGWGIQVLRAFHTRKMMIESPY